MAENNKSTIIIMVSDSSRGISQEDLSHFFDRFYRGKKSRIRDKDQDGGAVLGLAVAKGLVKAHGGKIWVKSEQGDDTQFRVSIPDHGLGYSGHSE